MKKWWCMALLSMAVFGASSDPFEHYNRHAFALNNALDKILLKPLAIFYHDVVPWPMRRGVDHVKSNLNEVPSVVNHVLQGRFGDAFASVTRLSINTTVGVGGLFDVASSWHLSERHNDFGLTLRHWAHGPAAYVVLPVLGPSSLQDMWQWHTDGSLWHPIMYLHYGDWRTPYWAISSVATRAHVLEGEQIAQDLVLDPYVFTRDTYQQYREKQWQARNGRETHS